MPRGLESSFAALSVRFAIAMAADDLSSLRAEPGRGRTPLLGVASDWCWIPGEDTGVRVREVRIARARAVLRQGFSRCSSEAAQSAAACVDASALSICYGLLYEMIGVILLRA